MFKFIAGIPIVGILLSFIINIILTVLLGLTYTSLTKEGSVASLYFEAVPNQSREYIAYLYDANDKKIGNYTIHGDQWRIDASFVKIKYWATLLGDESKYTLDRIEGRFKDIDEQNNLKGKSYKIESSSIRDSFSPFLDITYGSSVYKEIVLKTKYKVLKSPTGLLVREEIMNEETKKGLMYSVKGWFSK